MHSNVEKSRKTIIIDDAVSLEQSLVQRSKGKGRGRQRATSGFKFSSSQPNGVLNSKISSKTGAAQRSEARSHEANGSGTRVNEKSGRRISQPRTSNGNRNKNDVQLSKIAKTYVGIDKRMTAGMEEGELLTPEPKLESKLQLRPQRRNLIGLTLTGIEEHLEITKGKRKDDTIDDQKSARTIRNVKVNKMKVQVYQNEHSGLVTQPHEKIHLKSVQQHDRKRQLPHEAPDDQSQWKRLKLNPQAQSKLVNPDSRNKYQFKENITDKLKVVDSAIPKLPPIVLPQKIGGLHGTPNKTSDQDRSSSTYPKISMEKPFEINITAQNGPSKRKEPSNACHIVGALLDEPRIQLSQSETKDLGVPQKGEVCEMNLHGTEKLGYFNGFNEYQAKISPPSSLKEGVHGPGGDFLLDPDRITGKGHDYDPADARMYEVYLKTRETFYKQQQLHQSFQGGEKIDPDIKKTWEMAQMWYMSFTDKYPGRRLDQWVCGCQKLAVYDEGESEEE